MSDLLEHINNAAARSQPGQIVEMRFLDTAGALRDHSRGPSGVDSVYKLLAEPGLKADCELDIVLKTFEDSFITLKHAREGFKHALCGVRRASARRCGIITPVIDQHISCGIVTINLARLLLNKGIEPRFINQWARTTGYDIPEELGRFVEDRYLFRPGDLALHLENAFFVVQSLQAERYPASRRWGYFYHEQATASERVINYFEKHFDRLYGVSEFCCEAFEGYSRPVRVIPHGYDPKIFYPRRVKKAFWPEEFVFLSACRQQLRKGTEILQEAFLEEFGGTKEPVRLVLKDLPPQHHLAAELISKAAGCSKITWIIEAYSPEQMGNLFREADCFVFPTYVEGFGIPILEAKASRLPVITTCYGGQTDFCKSDDSYFLTYQMGAKVGEYICDTREQDLWAVPNKAHLRYLMRFIYENQAEAKNIAKKSYRRVKSMTWERVLKPLAEDIILNLGVEYHAG
jgi:glycosyltransferase involved in cell wall biosynthesis